MSNHSLLDLVRKIEGCDYECIAGPLRNNLDWQRLQAAVEELHVDKSRLDWLETQDCWIGIEGNWEARPKLCAGGCYCDSVRDTCDVAIRRQKAVKAAEGGEA